MSKIAEFKKIIETSVLHNMVVIEAWKIAEKSHAGQFRKDGQPYINHIMGVCKNVYKIIDKYTLTDNWKTIIWAVAILHDALEDNPEVSRPLIEGELSKLFNTSEFDVFYRNLRAITKKPKGEEEYVDYVLRVKNNLAARIVKIADLEHNMSDLAPGNLRDKYSLTKYFLEND